MAVAVAEAATPIGLLAWELLYASGVALKRPKKKKKIEKRKMEAWDGLGRAQRDGRQGLG